MMSGVFAYLACLPQLLDGPENALFSGSEGNITGRFSQVLDEVLKKHEAEVNELGYMIEDIGIHSWRKGAQTFMNSGSTAGPSADATCIRAGHSMGSTRDIYVLHEKAGDQYCGRILAGLPVNKAEFAVSYPDFTPVQENMTEAQLQDAQTGVDRQVNAALDELFGQHLIENFPTLRKFLRVGLASHLLHSEELNGVFPGDSIVRSTPLYTSNAILQLKQYVKITLPWEDGGLAYASGIPPHTAILSNQQELKGLIENIAPAIERMMDDRNMSGNLSETRMRNIVGRNQESMLAKIEELHALIRGIKNGGGVQRPVRGVPHQIAPGVFEDGPNRLWLIKGMLRRVPPDWEFPKGAVLTIYRYWHHGDEPRRISPMKNFARKDVSWKVGSRWMKNLSDCRTVCRKIDNEAKAKGLFTNRPAGPSRVEVTRAYYAVTYVLGLSRKTPTGRKRNFAKLTMGTIVRELNRQKHTDNEAII